ncbi:MAG: flagellar filament capping protein FliD [Treponema sp.]|jgi:flagellar hook-associated protein 2|nr:flagellar filament capping protein FliD [Treponema sp.]
MSDIYVPGVKSRFSTEKLIEDLMKVERLPKERAEKNLENLKNEKAYWQELGRRVSSLRDSARLLYSFQNPFNDRRVLSSNESAITGTATREAIEQERSFTVKQIARADRFLSAPLEESFKVDSGTYTFSVGKDEISFAFRGGSLQDFAEALNRRGRDKLQASLVTVEPKTKSLFIESKVTGAENRLVFSADAETLAIKTGIAEKAEDSSREIKLEAASLNLPSPDPGGKLAEIRGDALQVAAGGMAGITVTPGIKSSPALVLQFEAALNAWYEENSPVPDSPPGPLMPPAGSVTYGGITITNAPSSVPVPPPETPEPPRRVDDWSLLSLGFSDGSSASLPPLEDSEDFNAYQFPLGDIAGDRTISSIEITNNNTHRDISLRNIRFFDPEAPRGLKPRNPISLAQDAVVGMEGIEIKRPANLIDDLIPGVVLTAKEPSDHPVRLGIEPDRESIKETIISLVGNYNRLMAELNVLTRNDETIIHELSYLSAEEQDALKKKLGTFAGDSALTQFKNSLQRIAAAPYLTSAGQRDAALLSQIGIGTDVRRTGVSGGYDPSRLRGYLEIDEKFLDTALQSPLDALQQLFGYDSDGDLIIDTGFAHALETVSRPFVETGGIISLKTGTIDSRISRDERRLTTLEQQLAAKEAALKNQYGQMEGAYDRLERMSASLDQFSRQSNNANNR